MNAERLTAVKFNVLLDRSFSGPELMLLHFAPLKLVPSYFNFLHKVSN